MVKDIPLSEITLRRYEKPYDSSKRELVKKVCLSLGFLQPGDSRDIVVDLLMVLEDARKQKSWLSSFEIRDKIESTRKTVTASPNSRPSVKSSKIKLKDF